MHSNTGYTEFDSIITADGQEYRLHNKVKKIILSVTGEGHPPISYIKQRGPGQHGTTIVDYRLEERIIQWNLVMTAKNRYDYWENREWLLDILRLNRNTNPAVFAPLKLRKYYSNGKKRQIDVVVEAGPAFQARNASEHNEYMFQESLRFLAPDPVYYDPTQVCLQWTLVASEQLVFPITFDRPAPSIVPSNYIQPRGILFGSQVLSESLDVSYTGTWETFPVIQITGPLNGVEIYNETISKRLKLNYNIPGGRVVTINTQYGNKTIQDDLGTNLIGVIDSPIDLTTFKIVPGNTNPYTNTLRVIGSGANDDTAVQIAYYTRYYGI